MTLRGWTYTFGILALFCGILSYTGWAGEATVIVEILTGVFAVVASALWYSRKG